MLGVPRKRLSWGETNIPSRPSLSHFPRWVLMMTNVRNFRSLHFITRSFSLPGRTWFLFFFILQNGWSVLVRVYATHQVPEAFTESIKIAKYDTLKKRKRGNKKIRSIIIRMGGSASINVARPNVVIEIVSDVKTVYCCFAFEETSYPRALRRVLQWTYERWKREAHANKFARTAKLTSHESRPRGSTALLIPDGRKREETAQPVNHPVTEEGHNFTRYLL